VTLARAKKLGVECISGIESKWEILQAEIKKRELSNQDVAFIGNDLNDIECMSNVAVRIAVADAYPQVKKWLIIFRNILAVMVLSERYVKRLCVLKVYILIIDLHTLIG